MKTGLLSFATIAGDTEIKVGLKPGSSSIKPSISPKGFSKQEVANKDIRKSSTVVLRVLIVSEFRNDGRLVFSFTKRFLRCLK